MKKRAIASVLSIAAAGFSLAACSLIAPQATSIPYNPADGVSSRMGGGVTVNNAIILNQQGNPEAVLVTTIVNESTEPTELQFTIEGADAPLSFTVEPGQLLDTSTDIDAATFEFGDEITPGQTVVTNITGGPSNAELNVPVSNGNREYWSTLVPIATDLPVAPPYGERQEESNEEESGSSH